MSGERKDDKALREAARRAAEARDVVRRAAEARGAERRAAARDPVRRAADARVAKQTRRAFRPLAWAWLLLIVALLAPAYDLFLPAGYNPPKSRRTVVIERGQSLHEIALELQRVGVIRSQIGFLVLARAMHLDRSVKAGQYSFRMGVTVPALLRALDRGMYGLNLVTVPEGLMVSETAELIERQVGISAASIEALARDAYLLDSLEVGAPSLEGWLAPDSYEWLPGTSAEVVLRTMVARTRERVQRATAGFDSLPLGMNAHEVLTLASIVESESHAKEERPHIARVYLNRLERGMLLQADPTVGYALGRGPRSRLTFKDLRVVSPYNTYRHEGLPPGPICSPGLAAIEAVMTATPGAEDLYFVARGEGRHIFAPTYQQHLANIAAVKGRRAELAALASAEAAGNAEPDSGGMPAQSPLAAKPSSASGTSPLAAKPSSAPGTSALAAKPSSASGTSPLAAKPSFASGTSPLAAKPSSAPGTSALAAKLSSASGTSALAARLSSAPGTSALAAKPSSAPGTSALAAKPSPAPGTSALTARLSSASGTSALAARLSSAPGTSALAAKPSSAPGTSALAAKPSPAPGTSALTARLSSASGALPEVSRLSATAGALPATSKSSNSSKSSTPTRPSADPGLAAAPLKGTLLLPHTSIKAASSTPPADTRVPPSVGRTTHASDSGRTGAVSPASPAKPAVPKGALDSSRTQAAKPAPRAPSAARSASDTARTRVARPVTRPDTPRVVVPARSASDTSSSQR